MPPFVRLNAYVPKIRNHVVGAMKPCELWRKEEGEEEGLPLDSVPSSRTTKCRKRPLVRGTSGSEQILLDRPLNLQYWWVSFEYGDDVLVEDIVTQDGFSFRIVEVLSPETISFEVLTLAASIDEQGF